MCKPPFGDCEITLTKVGKTRAGWTAGDRVKIFSAWLEGSPMILTRTPTKTTMKHQLANRFCALLLETIGADGIAYCQERNKSYGSACPSHDLCDANEVMDEAFIDVVGSEMDCESDGDITLWNAAWTIARANNYKPA